VDVLEKMRSYFIKKFQKRLNNMLVFSQIIGQPM